jgi:hypothetical protein
MSKPDRALLGTDGNCGFALLGSNIQEGEAEFEPIEGYSGGPWNSVTARSAEIAIHRAYKRLQERIDYPISYALHDSHPRYC